MKKKYCWIIGAIIVFVSLLSLCTLNRCEILYGKDLIGECYAVNCCSGPKNAGCEIVVRNNCETNTNDIILDGLHQTKCSYDANKDGTIDSKDTLLELCKNYYSQETDIKCKQLCGCP